MTLQLFDVIFMFVDDVVCAQFLADNNWYRARVLLSRSAQQPDVTPTWENGLPVEVHYIDYGNCECLPLARYVGPTLQDIVLKLLYHC